MPELANAMHLTAEDWEKYQMEYEEYSRDLEEELDARRAEELEEIDYEYNRVYWRDEIEDEFLPF